MATDTTAAKLNKVLALAADPNAAQGERENALAMALKLVKTSEPASDDGDVLTDAMVKRLPVPPASAKVTYYSGHVVKDRSGRTVAVAPSGFGVRVSPGGTRVFVLNYRMNGVEYRYKIGDTSSWSVRQAVDKANELRRDIDAGKNPMDAKKAAQAGTVAAVLDRFIADHPPETFKSSAEYKSVFDNIVKPALGKLDAAKLTRADVYAFHKKVEKEHGRGRAKNAYSYLRSALNFYIGIALPQTFVFPTLDPPRRKNRSGKSIVISGAEQTRTRVLSNQELRDLWAALATMDEWFSRYVKFLLFSTVRKSEAANATWPEIQTIYGREGQSLGLGLVIPGERRKNGSEHVLPLTATLAALIGERPADADKRPYIFSGRNGTTAFSGFSQKKAELDKAINAIRAKRGDGPIEHWVLHDLRRTGATFLDANEVGASDYVIERVIGHGKRGLRNTYRHWDFFAEKKEALEKLDAFIQKIVAAKNGNDDRDAAAGAVS